MKRYIALLMLIGLGVLHSQGVRADAVPPPCLPNPLFAHYTWGAVPPTVSSRYDTYGIWVCEHPNGYTTHAYEFNLAGNALAFIQYKVGILTKAQADADCAASCVPPTQTEDDFMRPIKAAFYPLALVALNGDSFTRPVYAANADGTLNPTPVPNASVAVAARCNEGLRIVASPIYYSVAGLPNAASPGNVLGDVYTICAVNLPIGSN